MKIVPYFSTGLRRAAHGLRLRGPLAEDPTAQMFHVLLLIVAIWIASGFIVNLPLAPITFRRVLYPLFLESCLLAALMLIRCGQFRGASLVYLVGTWVWTTLSVSATEGIRSAVLILYGTLPISAAWLLGYQPALWTAGWCIGTMAVFLCLEMIGMPPQRTVPGTPLGIWILAVQATLIGTIPVGQVIKRLLGTLVELQRYKQDLELLVGPRTAELVQARDQAESANRAKSAFLANMSHELRTPLSVILASSSLLSESNPTTDQREDIAAIGRSGEHLLGLIDDVLDVAKIEAGKGELAVAASDLISTVRTVVEMMRGRAEEKHLVLVYYQAPGVPRYVRVDSPKLRQILINLLGNAIKFTKEGTVKLRLSAQPADEPGHTRLRFDIEDSGVGMPQHDLGRIFEPFERVRNADPQKGTGLGLTITRRFVELMGGTLVVESEVGRGSRFVVELPLERATESETYGVELAPAHPFLLESGQPEWCVLIVEDDPESAIVLRKMLIRSGFQVRVAENGVFGIETFQQWQPHFIWMDLDLPQLSGTETTRRIRKLGGGTEIKIAAITASALTSERGDVIGAGFDDLAVKPFRTAEIFFCMARHLGVRYSSSEEAKDNS